MAWNWKSSTQIWIFSVGRGNAAFVRTGLNQGFILDMNANDFDPAAFVEKNFLPKLDTYKGEDNKEHKIAQAILSHPHGDHIAQCERLSTGMPLYPTLLTCPHSKNFKDGSESGERLNWNRVCNLPKDSVAVEAYKTLYTPRSLPLQTIKFNARLTVPNLEYGIFYIKPPVCERLHPSNDNEYANSTSIMFYLRHGSQTILFPGDMTPEGMEHVLEDRYGVEKRYTVFDRISAAAHPTWHSQTSDQPSLKQLLKTYGLSVLVAPHHGLESCYSSHLSKAIRAGKPQLAVISERRKSGENSGSVHKNYQSNDGLSGLTIQCEGKPEFRNSLTTIHGHHILIEFEGSGTPKVWAEKDPLKLLTKL
jgi:beta-lactamase superfamily II metal-dependent hydrolase